MGGIALGIGKRLLKKVAKKAVVALRGKAGRAIVGGAGAVATIETIRPGTIGGITRSLAGHGGGGRRIDPGANGECPKGYHLNKSRTADGQAPRSFCTRNRKMNPANGKAAMRAGRRLRRTVKVLRKSFSLVQGKVPKGKFIPKKRGR